jgi:hypothetical protein
MKKILILYISSLFLFSCASPNSDLGRSIVYDTVEPVLLSSNKSGNKVGKACGKNILGIVSIGDFSIDTARKNGKITQITSIDKTLKGHIFIGEVCTIVRGQ